MPRINPYTPGAGTSPTVLAGRETQIMLIESLAAQVEAGRQANPIIYAGLRGMGKTSLLHRARDILLARGWLAGYYEVRRDVDPGVAIRTIVADSAQLSTGPLRTALANGGHRLGAMKLSLGPTGFGFAADTLPAGTDTGADPYPQLVSFLRQLGDSARKNGVGVALLIDELQIFQKRDLAVLVQALSAIKDSPIVLIGAGLPHLSSEMSKANTYAERFRYEEIDSLTDADARHAVFDPAFDQGVIWDDLALDMLVREAEGYPYFVQLYASETWVRAGDEPRVTAGHVLAAESSVRRQLDVGLYAARYDRLSDREREYVDGMVEVMTRAGTDAGRGRRVSSGEVAAVLGKTLNAVGQARDRVIRKGIVHSPQFGMLEFSVPGFADYVRRRSATAGL